MAATWQYPGGSGIIENEDGATWQYPGQSGVTEYVAAGGEATLPERTILGGVGRGVGGGVGW